MEDKKIPVSFNVQVYGDLQPYSSTISKARVRIFYRGLNRNYSYISDEFAEKLIATLPYTPVKAIYDENEEDFTDHGNGAKSLSKAYGVVPENGNGAWERHIDSDGVERTYYCTDVLLWTSLYENAKKIPGKCQSMELYEPSIKGDWKVFDNGSFGYEFYDGCFLGLQVLGSVDGEKVEPCFEGSAFYTLKEQFSEILDIAKNYNLNKEDTAMENTQATEVTEVQANEAVLESLETILTEETVVEQVAENTVNTEEVSTEETVEEVTESTETQEVAAQETTTGASTNEYEVKYNEALVKIQDLEQKFSKLSDEFSVLTEELNHIKVERDNLQEYKVKIEQQEKDAIFAKYSNTLTEDILKGYKEKMAEYSAIELDKELCFEAHKNDTLEPQTSNFSYKNNEAEEMSALERCLSKYKID